MQKIIKDIEKNGNNKIRVSISEFKGNNYIDVRVYYEDDEGEYKPTKKGVTFTPELISQVIDGLLQAEKEIKNFPVPENSAPKEEQENPAPKEE
ncbi:MAG: transcriptional coactivator p15/PC4 family protein [Candidatus Omnitrophica bacterium]|nr:transcriptional coactivator p15/PC4 family protein [Candidatus Omnitrophota bacterium]MBU1046980.1 transcriptional coactivator p15/PC4 family protein [Candidatus Omnitrophota bacterium]MBU1631248.1 transcriptional coactivator p15/PC4 family protein [Candidatus Omnitrophota bacterium]MBU1766810.1 transcriptional coactivator p15/PC4 family protein [Candidatus Omnitrophota bacterium]MBU1889526.1 transcriptional coactivator p15/PC4 family protein [Candidatus Omnitrophota bacterium]